MLAIEKIRKITPENLPPLTILTGDDLGQFELLKDEFLKEIHYDPADLNVMLFDMKETPYPDVELDLVSLPFFADEKIIRKIIRLRKIDRFSSLLGRAHTA